MSGAARDDAAMFASLSAATPPDPPDKDDRSVGIVTAAGGHELMVNAWLLCRRLTEVGCGLPIEIVHAASEVIPDRVRRAFPARVRFRAIAAAPPGYAIKPRALWTSRFDHCLWLDADNLPLRDPAPLLMAPPRACFWPDAFRTSSPDVLSAVARPLAALEFESGQMVIPTRACARALWIARELNETWRDAVYPRIGGDKDTFRMAWALAGEPLDLVAHLPLVVGDRHTCVNLRPLPIRLQLRVPGAGHRDVGLVQHGPAGRPLFLHRTAREWRLWDHRERLSWAHAPTEQVTVPRAEWSPAAADPVPHEVREASEWAYDRLREIEWFPEAFGVRRPMRFWLKHRFVLEGALAAAIGRWRGSRPVPNPQRHHSRERS